MKINNKILSALLFVVVGLNAQPTQIKINTQSDINGVVKTIKSAKLKGKKQILTRSYTPENINNFTYDSTRDTISSVNFTLDGQEQTLHIVHNKMQNDPSVVKIISDTLDKNDFLCSKKGRENNCTGRHFYTDIVWNSNSIGAKINLTKQALNFAGGKIILINRDFAYTNESSDVIGRINISRQDTFFEKPFFKVFIDEEGYLNAQFTRITGASGTAKTPKPIPFNKDIYIQANQNEISYEVAWQDMQTGEISSGKNSQQIPLPFSNYQPNKLTKDEQEKIQKTFGVKENIESLPVVNTGFGHQEFIRYLELVGQKINMRDYFWDTQKPMFAKGDISNYAVFQSGVPLAINSQFVNKILADLLFGADNFHKSNLRVYLDDNNSVVAVDIREIYTH